nr:MAG TPA: hypothetical protein [Caudoviricetes sp.]DAO90014.1 MAG TPA: hypothetical protein [Caudoviricetes sp.]
MDSPRTLVSKRHTVYEYGYIITRGGFYVNIFLQNQIFCKFLLTFIRTAYIIVSVREIRNPNKKQEAHHEIRNDDEALDDHD